MKCRYQEFQNDIQSVLRKYDLLVELNASNEPYSNLHFLGCEALIVNRQDNRLRIDQYAEDHVLFHFAIDFELGMPCGNACIRKNFVRRVWNRLCGWFGGGLDLPPRSGFVVSVDLQFFLGHSLKGNPSRSFANSGSISVGMDLSTDPQAASSQKAIWCFLEYAQ